MVNQPQGPNGPQSPKMINLKAMLASGQPIGGGPLFDDPTLTPMGTSLRKEFTLLEYRSQGGA
jgi:hypothetical protein